MFLFLFLFLFVLEVKGEAGGGVRLEETGVESYGQYPSAPSMLAAPAGRG